MGKAPAFWLYASDFIRDMLEHPLTIRGAWITVMCKAWFEPNKGSITRTVKQFSIMWGVTPEQAKQIIEYIKSHDIGDVKKQDDDTYTLISRRMRRDEIKREKNRKRQRSYRKKNE